MDTLNPKSVELNRLHDNFPIFAKDIPTLAFGENAETCVGSKYTCFQLVSDESANPNFQSDAEHYFIKLDENHWLTCKPKTKQDVSYSAVKSFIHTITKE